MSAFEVPVFSPMVVAQLRAEYAYAVPLWPGSKLENVINTALPRVREARAWCLERFGASATMSREGSEQVIVIDMNRPWASFGQTFLFKDPDAAFEFKMRWV